VSTHNDSVVTTFRVLGEAETVGAYRRIAGAANLFSGRSTALGRSQQQAGVAFAISAGALAFFGRAAMSASDDTVRLNRAWTDQKGAFPKAELRAFGQQIEDTTGVAHDTVLDVAGILGTFQIGPGFTKQLTTGVLNAREALRALGFSHAQIANQIGKAIQTGNAGALRRAGIVIDLATFKSATTQAERVQLVLQALQAQGGDAAMIFRDSLPGALQAFSSAATTAMQDVGSSIGGPGRAIVELGVTGLKAFRALPPAVKGAAGAIGVGLAGAVVLYSGATLLALNNTIRLAGAHFQAAAGARAQAAAESGLAGSLGAVNVGSAFASANLGAWGAGSAARVAGIGGAGAAGAGGLAAGGMLGRLGGFFRTPAGKATGVAGLVGLGLGMLPSSGNRELDEAKDIASAALTWGAVGATVGSLFSPVGTAIGGGVGAVAGGVGAFLTDEQQNRERAAAERGAGFGGGGTGLDRTNELLEEQTKILEAIRRDRALPSSEISGRDQVAGLFD
jgi:hypothetical protein